MDHRELTIRTRKHSCCTPHEPPTPISELLLTFWILTLRFSLECTRTLNCVRLWEEKWVAASVLYWFCTDSLIVSMKRADPIRRGPPFLMENLSSDLRLCWKHFIDRWAIAQLQNAFDTLSVLYCKKIARLPLFAVANILVQIQL